MELDKRIKAIADIQSVTDGCHDWEFMTKKGYFADRIVNFQDLSKCEYGTYVDYREHDKCFHCEVNLPDGTTDYNWFSYFIPEDRLLPKEPEKKYRAYTLKEFIDDVNLGEPWIKMRPVGTNKECKFLYTGYQETAAGEYICLGCFQFDFVSLFQNYEICINGEWKPLGVLDEEKE